MADEAAKLRKHLELLRSEYVKLQQKHSSLESRFESLAVSSPDETKDNFVSRLLACVANLFNSEKYSDVTIKLADQTLHAHKFVLEARNEVWASLTQGQTLDLSEYPSDVAIDLVKWVYTGEINLNRDDRYHLQLLSLSHKFDLLPLSVRCEQALLASITVKNCIQYFQTAEEIGAENLKHHCLELISSHWDDFTSEDFKTLPATLAYEMFKSKTSCPLHNAIRNQREDVVFLYLVEHDAQLPGKLDEADDKGALPLDLALQGGNEGIANTLVKSSANVNLRDSQGWSLLHRAIQRGNYFASQFLINNGADVNLTTPDTSMSALHFTAATDVSPGTTENMADIARQLLSKGAAANEQDSQGQTPLHLAILHNNLAVFSVLLERNDLDLERQNSQGHTALSLALQIKPPLGKYEESSFAAQLVKKGSSPNAVSSDSGDSLLHNVTRSGNEIASLFLVSHGADVNLANNKGESALHVSCMRGLPHLSLTLLKKGSNPNAQTSSSLEEGQPSRLTPLHLAISYMNEEVVAAILQYKNEVTVSGNSLQIIPKFTIKDSQGQTALALALWHGYFDVAEQLVKGGASVNDVNEDGMTLLHQAVQRQDETSALFLLSHGAGCNAQTKDKTRPLMLAVNYGLSKVVDNLCEHKAETDFWDSEGRCPLWAALEYDMEDIASILVAHGCDVDMWSPGPDGCQQTLLHKAIDESNEKIACFLIRSMSSINVTRQYPPAVTPAAPTPRSPTTPSGDGATPLHMCCEWGLETTATTLLEYNADINAQDSEGRTPLHIAIVNQSHSILYLLLSQPQLSVSAFDKRGATPFATAMTQKNHKAAQAILDRDPSAAEQYDSKGRNFLHTAVLKGDFASVMFLLSVRVDVNSRTQEASRRTPLHLAVQVGSEDFVRNFVLAGANVADTTPQKKTSLHLAAEQDLSVICQVLIEYGCPVDAVDDSLNNALHIACQAGHYNTVKVLLTESRINATAVNMRGQNALHLLGQFGKETAAKIFELFLDTMPEYDINQPDINGNTVLLLAYFNGNSALCRSVVRAGAALGVCNKENVSIFNAPVATKQLLFKLLDMLSQEPPWVDGENCHECGIKFGITTRKHHCRHCGRLLCSKCSDRDMPIIKYGITKPVRLCAICFDVLTLGGAGV